MPVSAARRAVAIVLVASLGALLVHSGPLPSATAEVAPGSTTLVSVAGNGEFSPTGGFDQEMSYDGTAVAFVSRSVLDGVATTQTENVYVRDLARGRTVLISRGQYSPPSLPSSEPPVPGLAGPRLLTFNQAAVEFPTDGDSYEPTISADGRFVAFMTNATNLVKEDLHDHEDVVLCDRAPNGVFDARRPDGSMDYRYSLITASSPPTRLESYRDPHLSGDASRIVWGEFAGTSGSSWNLTTALLRGPAGTIGSPATREPVSIEFGEQSLRSFDEARVSADGRFIVSVARIDNDETDPYAVFRTAVAADTNERVDFEADGTPVNPDDGIRMRAPSISGDGSVIAFVASRTTGQPNVYVVRPGTNESGIVSRNIFGDPVNGALPALSPSGRYLAFVTDAFVVHDDLDIGEPHDYSCLVPNDATAMAPPPVDEGREDRTRCHVVVRDLVVDGERATAGLPMLPAALASVPRDTVCPDGGPRCPGDSTPSYTSAPPSVSDTGRVAFDSRASDLADDDADDYTDSYVHTFEPGLAGGPVTFGPVTIGATANRSVELRHVGFGALVVESASITGDPAYTIGADTCEVLHTTGTCLVSVRFSPTETRDYTATLVLQVRGGRTYTVDLRGTGTPEIVIPSDAVFAATPDPVDFGARLMLSEGAPIPLTIRNGGGSPMTVTAATVDAPTVAGDYTVDGCVGTTLAPAATCVAQVRFSPRGPAAPGAPEVRTAVLRFTSTAPASPHLVGVRGSAVQPALDLNPAVLAPGRVAMATGIGFPPGKPVTVRFANAVGEAKATPDVNGRFSVQLLVFPKAAIGQRQVVAGVDGTPISAERPLLVVINTVSPAEFVGRG
ncbi:choice-of-anchor D domain-containing protein [Actinokineospora sp.]|uniref:choice-of-anchor D domain-containing protein n=1 Tax=Actinokineospora sp. TaxID=1872133 RepID=UPI003D6B1FAA